MDAAHCSDIIRSFVRSQDRVPLIEHNPRRGQKIEIASHEAQRCKTRTDVERSTARVTSPFSAMKKFEPNPGKTIGPAQKPADTVQTQTKSRRVRAIHLLIQFLIHK